MLLPLSVKLGKLRIFFQLMKRYFKKFYQTMRNAAVINFALKNL